MIVSVGLLLTIVVVGSMSQVLIQSQQRNNCVADGATCQTHLDCCSNSCLNFTFQCAPISESPNEYSDFLSGRRTAVYDTPTIDRSSLQRLVSGLFASTDRPANYNVAPSNLPESALQGVDFANRFDGTDMTPPASSAPAAVTPDCKEIGSKCYRDSECCSQRCHGFLHQCVT